MTKLITRTFVKGLVVVLPVLAAVYVVFWMVRNLEALPKGLLLRIVPDAYYVPGLGFVLSAAAVFLLGLLMYPWLTRRLLKGADRLMRRIPLFSMVYGPVRDFMDLLGGDMKEQLAQVVMIEIPNTNMKTLGFVTRQDLSDLPEGLDKADHVVVYVQWSSQVGGYCFIVPRDAVRPVDMTIEEGMRWALTAGISGPKNKGEKGQGTKAPD